MKTPPVEGWQPAKVEHKILIPTLDSKGVAETVEVEVDAWKDAAGEIFFDDEARDKIEAIKARRMGLLTPNEIKEIRDRFQVTQNEISRLLQIGEKTWTRWESGRERPSRSMNVLLSALRDDQIDLEYLKALRFGRTLVRSWSIDALIPESRPIVYRTASRSAQDVRRLLRSFDERVEILEKGAPISTVYGPSERQTAVRFFGSLKKDVSNPWRKTARRQSSMTKRTVVTKSSSPVVAAVLSA